MTRSELDRASGAEERTGTLAGGGEIGDGCASKAHGRGEDKDRTGVLGETVVTVCSSGTVSWEEWGWAEGLGMESGLGRPSGQSERDEGRFEDLLEERHRLRREEEGS